MLDWQLRDTQIQILLDVAFLPLKGLLKLSTETLQKISNLLFLLLKNPIVSDIEASFLITKTLSIASIYHFFQKGKNILGFK